MNVAFLCGVWIFLSSTGRLAQMLEHLLRMWKVGNDTPIVQPSQRNARNLSVFSSSMQPDLLSRLLLHIPLNDAAFFAYSSSTADTTLSLHLRVFDANDQSISHTMKSHFHRSLCDQGGIRRREGIRTRDTTKLSTV